MKKTQKTVDNEDDIIPITTQTLASANRFDYRALETNRAGRISFSQIMNALKLILLIPLIIVGVFWVSMSGATSYGYSSDYGSTGNFISSVLSCLNFTLSIAFAFWLYSQTRTLGISRYFPADILELPRRLMVFWDLIRGRVGMLESVVERYQTEQKGLLTGMSKVYFYTTGAEMFRVPKEGYKNFPALPRNCRVYYLPLSRVIVNLELL